MVARRSSRTARKAPGLRRDYSDIEYRESSIYDGPEPTRGLYRMELVHVGDYTKQGEEEPSSVQWTFKAMEGEENKKGESVAGWKASKYTTEKGAFVEQAMLVAMGVIKPNGSIDLPFETILKKAKPCRALVIMERYIPEEGDPEWKAVLTSNFLPDDGGASRAKDDDDDEDEEPPPSNRRSRSRKADPEPEPDDEDEEEGEDELPTEEELQEYAEELEALELADLKATAKEVGVTVKRGQKAEAIIDAILNKVAEEGFPEEDDEEEEEPEDEPEPPKSRRGSTRSASSPARSKSRGRKYDDEPPF